MPRKTTPLLSEAVSEYLNIRESHLARNTIINERIQLRLFVKGVGDRQIHRLTPQQVENWFASEAKRQKASSYNKTRQRVKGFISFAEKRRWIDADLMGMIGKRSVLARERLRLSPEELLELPGYAKFPRDRAILVLANNTALRADEIRNLLIRDLDISGGWLRVRISKSSREDVMPVTGELRTELTRWLKSYEFKYGPLQPDWYLFPSRVRGNGSGVFQMNPEAKINKMAAIVQRAMEDAGHILEPGEGIHTLRRSVARTFFDKVSASGHDAALRMTSSLLHHSSTQVTEVYLGLQHERLSRDDVLRGKSFLPTMVSRGGASVSPIERPTDPIIQVRAG